MTMTLVRCGIQECINNRNGWSRVQVTAVASKGRRRGVTSINTKQSLRNNLYK